jgi:subtilisin family serine protease
MEARRLLAADVTAWQEDAPQVFSGDVAADPFSVQSDVSANASADLGSLDGSVVVRSNLGWFNMFDTLHFSLGREADVSISLSQFSRDVNLYLTDASGQIVDFSANWGTASESIQATLDAGQYSVWTLARSYWPTGYRMDLTAELVPEVAPEPEPVGDDPAGGDPDGVPPLVEVDDFGSSRDWNINAIGAPEAWAAGYTGSGVTVAIVDTGVDLDHPDLVTNLFVNPGEIAGNGIDDDGNGYVDDVHGYDFANRDADPDDVHGHGTHVAGSVAAANNGFGATGVAPDATILPVKVLGDNGSGSSLDVAAGIRYAADLGAEIINLSLGGGYSSAIESAIAYAQSLGAFVVAASGNEYATMPGFPARFSSAYDNVLSVGAHDSADNVAAFSNDVGGSGAVQVDAPGVNIFSTYVGGSYATMAGTSMATPHVAGLAALALSADPSLAAAALRDLIVSGVVGQASQSDAVGIASTLYTVAYAAAGVSGGSSSAASVGSDSSGGSGGVGASSLGSDRALLSQTHDHRESSESLFETDWLAEWSHQDQDDQDQAGDAADAFALPAEADPETVDDAIADWLGDASESDNPLAHRLPDPITLHV